MTRDSREKLRPAPASPATAGGTPESIFEGVYRHFSGVPHSGAGFDGTVWTDAAIAKARRLIEVAAKPGTVSEAVGYPLSVLPVVAALAGHRSASKTVRILDFGGGLGFTYLPVKAGLADEYSLEYHIVEKPNICRSGEELFREHPEIHFHTVVPAGLKQIDIVHLGSSLHYVDDWRGLLRELACLEPSYVLLTDLTAGDIETFATAQNYYGSKIPIWFLNVTEVIDFMTRLGFGLLFKAKYFGTYLGVQRDCPQDNFPEHLRIGYTCMLLFGH